MRPESVLVVGAGAGGAAVVHTLRSRGFAGKLTLIGEEVQEPYDRTELSKSALLAPEPAPTAILPPDFFRQNDVELVRRTTVDAVRVRSGVFEASAGTSVVGAGDVVVLAPGASARTLPGLPDSDRIHHLRSWRDAHALRAALRSSTRVLVVGSGFVGTEVALTATALGCEVTVIEMAGDVLPGIDAVSVRRFLGSSLREAVAQVKTGSAITGVRAGPDGVEVELDGRGSEAYDIVLVGVGAQPRVGLATELGVAANLAGIQVDPKLRTTVPGVYAIGDAASRPTRFGRLRHEHWRTAQSDGVAVAAQILGEPSPPEEVPWFWSDQGTHRLEVVGHPRGGSTQVERWIDGTGLAVFHLDGPLLVGGEFVDCTRLARDVRRIVGRRVNETLLADRTIPVMDAVAERSAGRAVSTRR